MKRKSALFTAAALFGLCASAADGYTIRGIVPGLKSGAEVSLQGRDTYKDRDLGDTIAQDGSFVLRGSVESPTIARIRIVIPGEESGAFAIPLMVENADYTVVAEALDSLPPSSYHGRRGRLLENRVKISGGEAQRQYQEYRDATMAMDLHVKDAQELLYKFRDRPKNDPYRNMLAADALAAQKRFDEVSDAFVASHPEYSISGSLILAKLRMPFAMSAAELDRLESGVAPMTDARRLEAVRKAIEWSRKVMRDMPYSDFAVVDDKGAERRLSEFTGRNYVFVDFWASWCGPCRAAIPHVKKLHETYGDKLTILSVSLDSKEADWRKAMEQEQMPWTQLWASSDYVGAIKENYRFGFIPFFVVISPDGKIVHAGINQDALDAFLEDNID